MTKLIFRINIHFFISWFRYFLLVETYGGSNVPIKQKNFVRLYPQNWTVIPAKFGRLYPQNRTVIPAKLDRYTRKIGRLYLQNQFWLVAFTKGLSPPYSCVFFPSCEVLKTYYKIEKPNVRWHMCPNGGSSQSPRQNQNFLFLPKNSPGHFKKCVLCPSRQDSFAKF